jgi:hypothetical protein
MIMDILEIVGIFGILFMGYFIGRIIESASIGSWNYPKVKLKMTNKKTNNKNKTLKSNKISIDKSLIIIVILYIIFITIGFVNKTKYKIKNFKDVAQVIAILSVFLSGVIIGVLIGTAKYANNSTLRVFAILLAFSVMIIGTLIIFILTPD